MDHVRLTTYPFPDGMDIPRLMPFQEYPWNNDGYLAAEVLRLKAAHGLTHAVETGTCLGSTTLWLREHFEAVDTIEVNEQYAAIAQARIGDDEYCGVTIGDSSEYVGNYVNANGSRTLVFLDAHWGQHCPLLNELADIHFWNECEGYIRPCIVIHDFQVPGTDFGFDRFPDTGQPFCLDAIRGHLDRIYGNGGWKHTYPTKVEGARRGWISIEPI